MKVTDVRDPNEAWLLARNTAIANCRRMLATLEATPETAKDWKLTRTMQHYDVMLQHLCDQLHCEGEFADGGWE